MFRHLRGRSERVTVRAFSADVKTSSLWLSLRRLLRRLITRSRLDVGKLTNIYLLYDSSNLRTLTLKLLHTMLAGFAAAFNDYAMFKNCQVRVFFWEFESVQISGSGRSGWECQTYWLKIHPLPSVAVWRGEYSRRYDVAWRDAGIVCKTWHDVTPA